MTTYTDEEFQTHLITSIVQGDADEQTDSKGQILIHTGIYEWNDGTLRDEPDPEFYMLDDVDVIEDNTDEPIPAPPVSEPETERMIAANRLVFDDEELDNKLYTRDSSGTQRIKR